jgi:hypothetical protein
MLIGETVFEADEPAPRPLRDSNRLANGSVVAIGSLGNVGLVALGVDNGELEWRAGGLPLAGSRTVGSMPTAGDWIFIRPPICISLSVPNPLKTGAPARRLAAICGRSRRIFVAPRNQIQSREYKNEKERRMKFVLIAVILVSAAFARVDRREGRWAREQAREARQWAREEARDMRREAMQYKLEAQRDLRDARREAQRYRDELRRELRDDLRADRAGMRRIF